MKTTTRFIILFLVFTVGAAYYLIDQMVTNIRPGYSRALEESVNDMAQILSAQVEIVSQKKTQAASKDNEEKTSYTINTSLLEKTFNTAYRRKFNARIYELNKTHVSLRVYVTNAKGIVLYDSYGKYQGENFFLWNDVYLTLQGNYGARTTRLVKEDPNTSSIYIGAPIYHGEKIIGVLTVVKPKKSVNRFMEAAARRFTMGGIIAALLLAFFTILIFLYISLPLLKLTAWVKQLTAGKREPLPKLGSSEISQLGKTIFAMHHELDGRKHVETTLRTLTHELKSPLTSLLSASEILSTDGLNRQEREKFQKRLFKEAKRLQHIMDEISTLAKLEAMSFLDKKEQVNLAKLSDSVCKELQITAEEKKVIFLTSCLAKEKQPVVFGNKWQLRQVLVHLLSNAIDFADVSSSITIELLNDEKNTILKISNTCDAIPDYALTRVFEQFYSLPRPNSHEKSSGLGLAICKEIVDLHDGKISLENSGRRKVTATCVFKT